MIDNRRQWRPHNNSRTGHAFSAVLLMTSHRAALAACNRSYILRNLLTT